MYATSKTHYKHLLKAVHIRTSVKLKMAMLQVQLNRHLTKLRTSCAKNIVLYTVIEKFI